LSGEGVGVLLLGDLLGGDERHGDGSF